MSPLEFEITRVDCSCEGLDQSVYSHSLVRTCSFMFWEEGGSASSNIAYAN